VAADPFLVFRTFPTHRIQAETPVRVAEGASLARLEQLASDPLFSGLPVDKGTLGRFWSAIAEGETTVGAAAGRVQLHVAVGLRAVGVLTKMGLIEPTAD
jgi:hypothetical protein